MGISLLCVIFTEIYAMFGHGVRSTAMDTLFLYPLLGGIAVCTVEDKAVRSLWFCGIATLVAGALLAGILEIAGTASVYTVYFTYMGLGLMAFALGKMLFKRRAQDGY